MYQLAARDVQLQPPERKAQKMPESNKHDFFSAVYVYFCRKTVERTIINDYQHIYKHYKKKGHSSTFN